MNSVSQYEDDSCFFGRINAGKHQGQLQILRVDCVKWRVSRMQSVAKVLTSDHSFTIICERMVTDLDGGPGSDDDGIVNLTVHDEKNVMTRKMLAIEQFRDERDKALANAHFLTGLTEIFTPVFAGMMDRGLIKRDDTGMLAFAYTTPISWLIHQCDREPEHAEATIARIEAFSRHFIAIHGA